MNGQLWSWILTAIGLAGFFLAGKKVWWAWYVNIANQAVWLTYSMVTHQWGFLVGVVAYTIIFTKNAVLWTREEHLRKDRIFEEEVRRQKQYKDLMRVLDYAENDVKLTEALYKANKDIPFGIRYRQDAFNLDENLDSAIEDVDKDSRS